MCGVCELGYGCLFVIVCVCFVFVFVFVLRLLVSVLRSGCVRVRLLCVRLCCVLVSDCLCLFVAGLCCVCVVFVLCLCYV